MSQKVQKTFAFRSPQAVLKYKSTVKIDIKGENEMAGQIRMSPAELRDRAKKYGTSAREIDQILNNLKNLQEQLRGEWEGQAFARFDEQFNQLKPKVVQFSDLLDQIQGQLEKTATSVENHDRELSQNFGLN
ncbi:WXG100 family type VII secretion target [Listeria grayi DSM 20601]|uniref:WXG100 family type VII secretion target n=1 Tax=Listeria grayi DSM 20601 TaxID=525367 RepID=D7V0H0_LISGR|nr:WXG100 family type VII secretion target [Listeria grayi DSM 20601]